MTKTSSRAPLLISLTALTVSVAATGGPALAGRLAGNADRVDGFHAVGASATLGERAGKLVATDKNGRLPDDVMRPRTAFPDQVPYEHTVRGFWSIDDQDDSAAKSGDWGTSISYPARMPGLALNVAPSSAPPTDACPGSVEAPQAVPGNLCVYVSSTSIAGLPSDTPTFATKTEYGAGWFFVDDAQAGDVFAAGTWAASVARPPARTTP